MKQEQRKSVRLNKLLPVEFAFGETGIPTYKKVVLLLYSINISGGGIMVISNVSLKEGFRVKLNIDLGNKIIKDIDGIIRWNKFAKIPGLFELGIEFVNLEPKKQETLVKFVSEAK